VKFMATLAVATEFTQGLTHPPHSIEVILTGGAAKGCPWSKTRSTGHNGNPTIQ
jgi:hypothetical protein